MRREHKTIVLWAVLILMFVMVYSMFAGDEKHDGSENDWLIVPILVVVAALVAFLVTRNVRESRRFLREHQDALGALHRGELAKARELFSTWAESDMRRVAAVSRHNLAWTLMRQGDLKYAIVMAENATQRYPYELKAMAMLLTTEVDLALFHALLGDIDAAEQGMARLDQPRHLTPNSSFPAMKVVTRAVLDCRSGRSADAARALEENWAMCESSLTGDVVRVARVVRAFAIASADTRDAGKAELQLVNARPAFAGEYDFLGKAWPEMQAFLAAHELATSSGQAS